MRSGPTVPTDKARCHADSRLPGGDPPGSRDGIFAQVAISLGRCLSPPPHQPYIPLAGHSKLADELWGDLLPLLRARDPLAWNQVIDEYFTRVHGWLLHSVRRRNSSLGARVPDDEVRDLTAALTDEAFLQARQDIESFDPKRSAFPTWVQWKGMNRLKGTLDRELRGWTDHDSLDRPPRRRPDARDHLQTPLPSTRSAEDDAIDGDSATATRDRIDAILTAMPVDWAKALIQVWMPRLDGMPFPVKSAASEAGLSPAAMDSLYRRAIRDFLRRWHAQDVDNAESQQA